MESTGTKLAMILGLAVVGTGVLIFLGTRPRRPRRRRLQLVSQRPGVSIFQ